VNSLSASPPEGHAAPGGRRELILVVLAAALLTILLTYPLAFRLGHVGRVDNGDGQFCIWNVAWVARTLVLDPLHVYDANIFYPHLGTLAYSEGNLGAGALAIPAYWATRNPYFAHNFVLLLAFGLSAAGMYYLARYLTGDRRAAAVAGIAFGFCPYMFSWTAEIHLLMTAGFPIAMLAFHRAVDEPGIARGAVLGAAMAAQALCCGYYAIFLLLLVGYAFLVATTARARWADRRHWTAFGVGALVAIVLALPVLLPYSSHQSATGFSRSLESAVRWSADWRAYLASGAPVDRWLLRLIGHWNGVMFPGWVATLFGIAGGWVAWRTKRELAVLYGGAAALAFWASFGPRAGLYTVLYHFVPMFSFLRAPGRFSLLVVFGLSVLAAVAVGRLLASTRRQVLVTCALLAAVAAEGLTPLRFREVPPVHPVYHVLATLPRAPTIELPFYYRRQEFFGHVKYMLASTAHWMPLVNGYSDYIPQDFVDNVLTLAPFPSIPALQLLKPMGVRYAVFHMALYNEKNRAETIQRISEAQQYLRPLYIDDEVRLYEIVGYPK
jgi:hypothetical protein